MSLDLVTPHLDRFLEELKEWLRIPSISADPAYKDDVRKAANWLTDHLKKIGGTDIQLHETKGHPIITARFGNDPKKKTVLVYGHYDVQPATPLELWTTPPFEPNIRDGKIYARGADDDKGQFFSQIKAIDLLQQSGELPCNIIVLSEGEEECGSENLPEFVKAQTALLACDAIIISDTTILASDIPSITVGLRGLTYIEVTLTGPDRDLHSGVYGGAVGNPINALAKMIAQLHDENGKITIPDFYNNVPEYSIAQREKINKAPFNEEEYKQEIGIKAVYGEKGFTTFERIGIRPCLDVNGIWGGYTGEGAKTVMASKAHAKISMRLVPSQPHAQATTQLIDYLQSITPSSMTLEARDLHGGPGAVTSTDSAAYKAASDAFTTIWGKEPIPTYEGASIPIISVLNAELKAEVVMMGFGLNSDAIHSPNENYPIEHIRKGIATIMEFYKEFAKK
jgi:acetylornithine deacetylase/succinyl-diaminopimelate desuccinylase-like protein